SIEAMRLKPLAFIFIVSLFCFCTDQPPTIERASQFVSQDPTSFEISFTHDGSTSRLLSDSIIYGSGCQLAIAKIGNQSALEIKTDKEFSDAFVDLEQLFGYTFNFSQARYLSMKLWVPDSSWISTMKLNLKDTLGNFGGFKEVFNNFHGNYNQWVEVVIDMQTILPDFQNWAGDENPLSRVAQLSLNPYNAHQADSSVIYVNNVRLSNEKPDLNYTSPLVPLPESSPNTAYKITFDDDSLLRQLMAYRSFESSYQAFAKGIGGNKTRAIRLKGKEENKHIAFLPMLDKMTGKPVDFTQVKRIYFSYYLTEESDNFDGSWLSLVSEHWNDILIAKDFYSDYEKGDWHQVSVNLDDLDFERVKGEGSVLPNVYELRVDLNYFPENKNVEMWIDDFGWE
ncbi:MAG: hypothetical protein AAF223_11400, partial [Bacteroidota bacterium]